MEENRPKILMIVSRFPYPLDKGDKLRAFHQLKGMSKYCDITLVAFSDSKVNKEHFQQVEPFCEKIIIHRINWLTKSTHLFLSIFNKKPFQTGYFFSWKAQLMIKSLIKLNGFNHIYCQLVRTSEYVKNIHSINKTLDYMDALSAGIERRIELQPFYKKWIFRIEANRLTKYEQHIFDFFEHKTIISSQDRRLIHHPNRDEIKCIPNGIDDSFFNFPKKKNSFDFVFVGNMSYPPNIEAVHYVEKHILSHFNTARLLISGSSPHPSVIALAEQNDRIEITGWIDDIRESYAKGYIFLAPMMIGTGMQNKLLEAMAMGIPCITTTLANNAIQAKHNEEILVGDTPKEIINCISQLKNNPDLYRKISRNGSSLVKKRYTWEESVNNLLHLMLD